ncbi:hypothetical protein [Pedobacter sandarakinus]|uniref:hypothetical protein n=1 Tax=Pedobacter sandarakinus TaxID=353156 RepID=UPI00224547E6|nr:hypothetical protein [Pedobacter sandarakinus]MCX2573652.1 hypothetical protein [Pedobacter sandarakinus]
MTTTETVTLISIGLTFSVGVFNLIITFRNVRKTTFINSVTASRIKYIQDLRDSISRFCALVNSYSNRISKLSYDKLWELHKEADTLKFQIRLYLNPEDEYWDSKIINLIDQIVLKTDKDPTENIKELITITQYLLKLEWEGAKMESEIGIVSEIEKKELYNKYVERHKQTVAKK